MSTFKMGAFGRLGAAAVPLFVGLTVIGATMSGSHADQGAPAAAAPAASGPLHCEIQKATINGMMTLTPIVRADVAASGSYRFRVIGRSSGGSSNIDQGGPLSISPPAATRLGAVSINAGGAYDATLTVTANGTTVSCNEKAGGGAI